MRTAYMMVFIMALSISVAGSMVSPAYGEEGPVQKEMAPAVHDFSLERMAVATAVQDREPVDVSDTFPASTEKVYCFIEAKDISADVQVTFVWYYEGKELHRFTLPLEKGPKWRTFSSKNLYLFLTNLLS